MGIIALTVLAVAVVLGWPRILSWYRFTQVFESLGRNAQGYSEYRHRQTGIVLVWLPGGKYWMGSQETDPKGINYIPDSPHYEHPVHKVTLSKFMIGECEVTQAQWKAVMGGNSKQFEGEDVRPLEKVTWEEIQAFKTKTGLMLPTEAQWEYAFAGKLDQGAPNRFGLRHLAGNVWEWCEDAYEDTFYKKPNAIGPDPVCASGSGNRVVRGGSYGERRGGRNSSDRNSAPPGARHEHFGFRVAAPAP